MNVGTFESDFSKIVSPELARHVVGRLRAGETVEGSLLISFGFSFGDQRILGVTKRALDSRADLTLEHTTVVTVRIAHKETYFTLDKPGWMYLWIVLLMEGKW